MSAQPNAGDAIWLSLSTKAKRARVEELLEELLDVVIAGGRDPSGIEGRLIAHTIAEMIDGNLDNAFSNAIAAHRFLGLEDRKKRIVSNLRNGECGE